MKKVIFAIALVAVLASCSSKKDMVIPRAISTIGTASLNDLNLQRHDYEVINTVTAEATVSYKVNKDGTHIIITGEDDDFQLDYTKDKKKGWRCKFAGILKAGYLQNISSTTNVEREDPAEIVHRLALYRLISQVKAVGGDGMVAPTILTNVEQNDNVVYFRTTTSAKAVKLKAN